MCVTQPRAGGALRRCMAGLKMKTALERAARPQEIQECSEVSRLLRLRRCTAGLKMKTALERAARPPEIQECSEVSEALKPS
ncbi:hypothetical protein THAOC_10836 [Thalassiosira oceanica]|uniref:Uncharacterized protein n=1 Tax=Thalassiosira oceanica TaxID=159749 RepID=K0SST4_THAOC|nr:hypothetical protein THAOC_10836 [Thalassiosira oceanica]|eukprot:EJK68034.1 hypothetical protein THAOC_10836 [Thalassiosira oceanica]